MNKREMKKLSRADLLEMLIIKTRENDCLRAELENTKNAAAERPAACVAGDNVGADNVLLQALKAASEQYLETVRRLSERPDAAEENKR